MNIFLLSGRALDLFIKEKPHQLSCSGFSLCIAQTVFVSVSVSLSVSVPVPVNVTVFVSVNDCECSCTDDCVRVCVCVCVSSPCVYVCVPGLKTIIMLLINEINLFKDSKTVIKQITFYVYDCK